MITRTGALVVLGRTLTRQSPATTLTQVSSLPRMAHDTWRGTYPHLSRSRLFLYALAGAYVLSPLDLAPEIALLGLGLLDDAIVLTWLSGALLTDTRRYLDWEKTQKAPSRPLAGQLA